MLPHWLLSVETGEPFRHCIHCHMPLDEIDAPWLVNKEYRRGECIREYAICEPCREHITASIARDCRRAVRAFLEEEIDWHARAEELGRDDTIEGHLAACIRCHAPRESLAGFSLSAQFDASGQLLEGPLPLILCDDCTTRLRERLSPATLDTWQRFVAMHFAGPDHDENPPTPGLPGGWP
jgi:hypothetical protein